jgi:5-(carboxyamino)imidazole ribonucleotide mutase
VSETPLVAVIMGSKSDWETMRHADEMLTRLGVPHECAIVSAHRPAWMAEYAGGAEGRGLEVIIAGAGGAAHLPGMVAAHTLLPVLGVPVESHALKGLDSLLSIVQMPGGVPVGTLAIGRGHQRPSAAAIVRAQRPAIRAALRAFRESRRAAFVRTRFRDRPILPGSHRRPWQRPARADVRHCGPAHGHRVHAYSPDSETPTGQVSDVGQRALRRPRCGAALRARRPRVTFEFENILAAARRRREERVRPRGASCTPPSTGFARRRSSTSGFRAPFAPVGSPTTSGWDSGGWAIPPC